MTNLLGNRTKNNIYIILPIAIAVYLIYPLFAGYYSYPIAEYSLYKSFMVNFIDSLKRGVLPTWNEYVGCGHPAMYFGHYPISQNTIIYMLFGFSDFTYYLTRCLNLIILLFTFIYACKFLRLSYWIALLGALTYFSVNFVSRIFIAETIGNLIVVYPLLMILVIKIIQGYKMKDILLFSLVYIFWLSGGHIIYVCMHFIMLSIFFWIAVFVFHGAKARRFKETIKFIWLYAVLFILPFLATLYQYYFVYDVIADSNRLKAGLIVSPFNALVWKQLLVSFKSSSYFWAGVLLIIIYTIFKLVTLKYKFLKIMKLRFYVIAILSVMIFILLSFPERNLSLLRLFGINYNIKTSDCKENYVLVKDSKENIIKINDISTNTSAWVTHLAALSKSDDSSVKSCFKITTLQGATGYVYYTVATKPGETYKISVLYKKGTAANGQIKVGTTIDDTSLYYSGVLSDNDWKEYSASFRPTTTNTYITLVNLTSNKGEDAYFGGIALYKYDEKPNILSDYIPILKSLVFRISLFVFFLINLAILYKKRKNSNITLSSILSVFIIFIIYVSLLSYYFFSPANIIGDVNGYDFDLFKELSIIYQIIFVFCVLYSMKGYHSNKVVKLTIFSLGALYLLRSHLTIPLLRFTGIVWYATRDGSIFSFFFAVLFMFGLKLVLYDFSEFFKNKGKRTIVSIKYFVLFLLLILLVRDSYDKFYKGTSHRFIYRKHYPLSPAEKGITENKQEASLLKSQLLTLDKQTNHFYRTFTPENNYIYLTGDTQQYKIHEAAIYESSYSNDLYEFYNYTILGKTPPKSTDLKEIMPYFLFTKHVHAGLGLQYRDILYSDFFIFNPPKDAAYLKNQSIEFLWDLMQVKYLIIGPEFSKALASFTDNEDYKLLSSYPQLNLNLYEIVKNKSYSKLVVYPLGNTENYDKIIETMNSKDIRKLKDVYSKLIFLDKDNTDFKLLRTLSSDNARYYEIDARKEGILVDFESWHRHWQLKVNDKNKKLYKAFRAFKGIKIEPGINRIKLFYSLKYFKELFFLSVFVILVYITFLVSSYRKKLINT